MTEDLNRRVAEALGYKFDDETEGDYAITTPDGDVWCTGDGFPPFHVSGIPGLRYWSGDINAALELAKQNNTFSLCLSAVDPGKWEAKMLYTEPDTINCDGGVWYREATATSRDPAEAICLVWLAWKEANG